jgi:hypothetical protein
MDWIYWLILGACGVASFLLLMGLYEAWRIYWSPTKVAWPPHATDVQSRAATCSDAYFAPA